MRPSLNVRESNEKGMYVAGLEHETVVTPEEASECLRRGNEQRATAATGEFYLNFEKKYFHVFIYNLDVNHKN